MKNFRPRRFFGVIFILGLMGAVLVAGHPALGAQASISGQKPQLPTKTKIMAYYVHGNFRCPTCRKIEAYSLEAIQQGFAEELKSGRLEWRLVNVDEDGNKHFMKDYRLLTWSLVLVSLKDGQQTNWKNLDRVWELVRDREKFTKYVQGEVQAFLRDN